MADKKVIIAIFESEAAADEAVAFMNKAEIAHNDAIGVLALDEHGEVKTHKVGSRSFFKGAGIGAVLGLLGPIGLGAAVVGGGMLGLLHHKGLGLSEADRDRITDELQNGKAAVGVLLSEDYEETGVVASLRDLGGVVESHTVSDDALEEVAAASAPPAD